MRILVALDNSPRAPDVLATAARYPDPSAKLILYRAITVPPEMPRALLVDDARLEDLLRANARSELEQLAAAVDARRIEDMLLSFASPWDGICRAARDRDVDLVVIGSHGYGRLERLLGTTVAKVVNHIDRDVLVVRASHR